MSPADRWSDYGVTVYACLIAADRAREHETVLLELVDAYVDARRQEAAARLDDLTAHARTDTK